jgi:hypothetical protein
MRLVLSILFCLFLSAASADNGYLSGSVRDATTREPMLRSSIYIRELSLGTTTDIFGNFKIVLKPGTYTVEASYVGYKLQGSVVTIAEHQTIQIFFSLEPSTIQLSDVVVKSEAASQRTNYLSALDLKLQPVTTSQDVLRLVPGLFIAQHAGGGKAEQIFLRGFDIDHGTDINLTVDGMPVNMVSHAHGQGYSDLHFVIPETIRNIDFGKGPHHVDHGDFATAGYAAFHTKSFLAKNTVKVEGGQFGYFRNVNQIRLFRKVKGTRQQELYMATEAYRSDGFFDLPQNFRRVNGFIKYHRRNDSRSQLTMSASAFQSTWRSSGQIPERAVMQEIITQFGHIDDIEGGTTSRYNFNVNLTNNVGIGMLQQSAYITKYDFDLASNFTFYLNDPVNGDRIRQRESRNIFGYNIRYNRENAFDYFSLISHYGFGIRHDGVANTSLEHIADRDHTLDFLSNGGVAQANLFAFVEETVKFADKVNLSASLRADNFLFGYQDRLMDKESDANAIVLSPKITVDYSLTTNTKVFFKSGYGFHSNDARLIGSGTVSRSLPKAFGIDVGIEWKPSPRMFLSATAWLLDLEQELVYVGDEGIVEPSAATRRKGLDMSIRYQVGENFFADADMNGTLARFREPEGKAKYIPLAPSFTSTGGLHYTRARVTAIARYRYLADRPANEDFSLTATAYCLLDATVSLRFDKLTVTGSLENILDTTWREAQFATESRLKDEAAAVSEIHFTPGTPRMLKIGLELEF